MVLSACGFLDSQVSSAVEIIKQQLRDPSSFSLADGEVVWSGKNAKGDPAYIVRVEYDADNAFGGTIRDCKFVAFWEKGGSIHWRKRGAIDDCGGGGMFTEEQMIDVMSSTLKTLGE